MLASARYRFVRTLGAGAAGGVYLVEDRVLGGPLLALKRVEASSDPSFRDSFAREFAVLSSVALPGVARVFDLGVLPAEGDLPAGPFFTRSYVEGEPLDTYARALSLDAVIGLFLRVLETVATLHRLGVVHGDLKPANIIVDARGVPHLIDFGLASRSSDAHRLAGGTPAFMAPELLRGQLPSSSADIYALGATLWLLVTGALPHADLGERAIGAKLRGEVPKIPDNEHGKARAVLAVAQDTLVDDSRARPPSADELAALIERAWNGGTASLRARAQRVFVAPRPRGREEVVAALEQAALGKTNAPTGITLLHGARGMGKSTLLCELKWRLQLAGSRVIELRCGSGGLDPLTQLLQQALSGRTDVAMRASLSEPAFATDSMIDDVARALSSERADERAIVLVDDIDRAEPGLLAALRAAVHGDGAGPPRVIASSEMVDPELVQRLGATDRIELVRLDLTLVQQITREVLGPVEAAAEAAIAEHAAGNPGLLVEALAALSEHEAVTAPDVARLSPGEIGDSLARGRMARASITARLMLGALAAASGPLPQAFLTRWLGAGPCAEAVRELEHAGLVRGDGELVVLLDLGLSEWLRQRPGDEGATTIARRLLAQARDEDLDVTVRAQLALLAEDAQGVVAWAPEAAQILARRGANAAAARLYEAALLHVAGGQQDALLLRLSDVWYALGDYPRAVASASQVLANEQSERDDHARARVIAGRAQIAMARFDDAVAMLSAVSEAASPSLRAESARELARAFLRRGAHAEAQRAVELGLTVSQADDAVRGELFAIDGLLRSFAGDHAAAQGRFAEALAVSHKLGSARDEAQVLGYAALGSERAGDLERAFTEYERCLAAARAADDLGLTATYALNLGNVAFRLGRTDVAEQHYTLAARLSRRAGKATTALLADNNLAHLHLYLGLYARARSEAELALAEAERLGLTFAGTQAIAILADVDARTLNYEAALQRYDAAASAFKVLARSRELSEVWLDAAEALLDRAGPSDTSAAATKLALARSLIEQHSFDDFRPRLRFLLARARAAHGDIEGAVRELEQCEEQARKDQDRELLWQILAASAQGLKSLGQELRCVRAAREAAETLEALAGRIPREAREAFRNDPRRRKASDLAEASAPSSLPARSTLEAQTTAFLDRRFERLLEIIKRLAREHDLDRLLERVTDAAVELSGAERGFVLLVDDAGQLAPHTVRGSEGRENDPHVAFSRSIAEAVLIDGEPIITVNARDDRRVNEFMSVHRLMLKSVACIPINGPGKTVGVLYLEHRVRAGRFQEADLDLLVAFADQAAIALENARLWAENERKQRELEASNEALLSAKEEIERILEARTEELDATKRDLGRARDQLAGPGQKHGLVGQSAAMRRVFTLIERMQDTSVPVVIQGESGTGKELVARAIHQGGPRKKAPFVAINCAALPETLLESELFGHVRGAFTGADRDKKGLFAQAHGGTLFLDEFADMPMRMQVDLLRVLQEGRVRPVGGDMEQMVDVRVIAASNRPLQKLLADRRLREDLYYRLSVVEIPLPSLRERAEDVPALCEHFLQRIAAQQGGRPKRISRGAVERLVQSGLPGNVRQLEHLLLSAATLGDGPVIEAHDLPLDGPVAPRVEQRVSELPVAPATAAPSNAPATAAPSNAPASEVPEDLTGFKNREKQRILAALDEHGWNRARTAQVLGMPRRTFYRRLAEFGIL